MNIMDKYTIEQQEIKTDESFGGREEDGEAVDLYGPVDFGDIGEVLKRIFAVVERYPTGGETAWFFYCNDWDRRFVLNIYDMWVTTGKAPLSPKQIQKAKVILRKMITPPSGGTGHF